MSDQLFAAPMIPQLTLEQALGQQVFIDPVTKMPVVGTPPNSNVQVDQRLIGGVIEKASFKSAYTGARIEIFPSSDYTIGFVSYASNGNVVFETIVAGTDSGDVVIGDYAGGQGAKWDQSAGTFTIKGALSAGSLDIPDTTTANSFHVDNTGNAWWGANNADFISNHNNAIAYVLKDGVARFTSIALVNSVIVSGLVGGTDLAIEGWQFDAAFSVTDLDTVAWGTGTLRFMDGTTFSISAGNTGNMSARTYIYFDKSASQTVLQTTTTASSAVGANKVLIATAINGTDEATFQVYGGRGGLNVDGSNIAASSITANEIAANTITANKMNVSSLSAISANIGTITAGTLTLDTAGYVRGGQTDYNTGTGFFLGYSGGAYKLSIGDGTAPNSITWDGSTLLVNGFNPNDFKGAVVSNNLRYSADTERTDTVINTDTKFKEVKVRIFGTVRIKYDIKSSNSSTTGTGQVFVNGVAVGTRNTVTSTYVTFTEDVAVSASDLVQLYLNRNGDTGNVLCRNFRVYYDLGVATTVLITLD